MKLKLSTIVLIFVIFIFPMVLSGQTSTNVTIKGNISDSKFTSVKLLSLGKTSATVSQAQINDKGAFELKANVAKPDFFKLQFDNSNIIMFILFPGDMISMNADASALFNTLQLEGSPQTLQVVENQRALSYMKKQSDSIVTLSYTNINHPKADSLSDVYTLAYNNIEKKQNEYINSFLIKNPCSLACMFFPEVFPVDEHIDIYKKVDSCLYALYPDNIFVENLHFEMEAHKKLGIGMDAPEIALPDTNGNIQKLSNLKGKVVLIDFWASWCSPCRKESPNMVKLYQDYHKKGFDIFGVSLDKDKSAWVAAINKDKLSWHHVSDLQFWQSVAAKTYNVSSIPYTVLIDKNGKIAAKGLRGEELFKKVDELTR